MVVVESLLQLHTLIVINSCPWRPPIRASGELQVLGSAVSGNLSFSQHIQTRCAKARKILGLLYRRFCKNTSNEDLLQLYISLVRPHLEYASPVWNPYLKDIKQLEEVEKFALKMIWDLGYQDLLGILDITLLQHVQSSLCTLFKIIHGSAIAHPILLPLGRITVKKRTDN